MGEVPQEGLSEEANSTQREDGKKLAMQTIEKGTFQGEGTLRFKRKRTTTTTT